MRRSGGTLEIRLPCRRLDLDGAAGDDQARTVLVFEETDILFTNPLRVFDTLTALQRT
jgi:hypothetical protein